MVIHVQRTSEGIRAPHVVQMRGTLDLKQYNRFCLYQVGRIDADEAQDAQDYLIAVSCGGQLFGRANALHHEHGNCKKMIGWRAAVISCGVPCLN